MVEVSKRILAKNLIISQNSSGLTTVILVILAIFRHGRQGSPMVAKGFQGPRGTPGMGEMSYNQIDHIQVIFRKDIQNRAIFLLKFLLKTKRAYRYEVMGL